MTVVPSGASAAVLQPSEPVPSSAIPVVGPNFDAQLSLQDFLKSFGRIGFQAANLGRAMEIVDKMRTWRLSDDPVLEDEDPVLVDPVARANVKCNIFLGYTSNLISSGLRDVIRYLVQHKHVAALVTTAGGIEEDIIKCLAPTFLGATFAHDEHGNPMARESRYVDGFTLSGADLRSRGLNRIGNLVVPNDNYCKFEDWLMPILDAMLREQREEGAVWTPSRFIARIGKEINNEESVYYWAWKNDIPVFCPALTDGSIGDMLYFHSFKSDAHRPLRGLGDPGQGLVIDIVRDIRALNERARTSRKAGMIILGGGVCKHQIANAMLIRNGVDYSVYINTGQEFDGSDSGARPDEAVSWGKIRAGAESVKVYADATLAFPLLVAATFGKHEN
ncbi:Deoxyhypusine synthase [Fistulina hepatica ATCC 64428]|uniref:deoxyhypusine synthase n=1 Tax=Fistulina hepatica ATCC 64428 TaxID=1128425 RepID=A0A0D7A1V7_9AGAR|nr:Deoxyhypusine synthase [Fistulina hepatica ATCC 64428]